jgi:transketolase
VPILKMIPNMQIVLPGNSSDFNSLFNQSYNNGLPTYYRLSEYENKHNVDVIINKANVIKTGTNATIICVGNMLDDVIEASEGLDVTILYYTTIAPFDYTTLIDNFNENIIICEPYYAGAINYDVDLISRYRKHRTLNIGIPRMFLTNYGIKEEHDIHLGLDKKAIHEKISEFIC